MRRAHLRTEHGDQATAQRIAAALRPDNTDEMTTRVEDDAVVTTVERETTGGLQSTVDDYVVNLRVAARLAGSEDDDHSSESTDVTQRESIDVTPQDSTDVTQRESTDDRPTDQNT